MCSFICCSSFCATHTEVCSILLTKDQGHVLLDMSTYWGEGVLFVHLCQKSISPHFSMFQFKE